jgi:hypothetical protein
MKKKQQPVVTDVGVANFTIQYYLGSERVDVNTAHLNEGINIVQNSRPSLSDKTFATNNKPTLRLTEHRKLRIVNQIRKYAEQIGITGKDMPSVVFTRKEVLEMPKELIVGRRTVTSKYFGICFVEAKTLLINVKKHRSFEDLRKTIVHELVHYRFRYLKHGKEFECRIDHILKGKRYPVRSLSQVTLPYATTTMS